MPCHSLDTWSVWCCPQTQSCYHSLPGPSCCPNHPIRKESGDVGCCRSPQYCNYTIKLLWAKLILPTCWHKQMHIIKIMFYSLTELFTTQPKQHMKTHQYYQAIPDRLMYIHTIIMKTRNKQASLLATYGQHFVTTEIQFLHSTQISVV